MTPFFKENMSFWILTKLQFCSYLDKSRSKFCLSLNWGHAHPSDGGDGGGGDGLPRTLSIWPGPGSITPRDQISRAGNPSLRWGLSQNGGGWDWNICWTSISVISHLSSSCWTSMPSVSQYNSNYWTSMPSISHSNS